MISLKNLFQSQQALNKLHKVVDPKMARVLSLRQDFLKLYKESVELLQKEDLTPEEEKKLKANDALMEEKTIQLAALGDEIRKDLDEIKKM